MPPTKPPTQHEVDEGLALYRARLARLHELAAARDHLMRNRLDPAKIEKAQAAITLARLDVTLARTTLGELLRRAGQGMF